MKRIPPVVCRTHCEIVQGQGSMIGKHVRRWIFVVMVLSQVGCGLLDPDRAMVARVGNEKLTVAGLAETVSRWETRPKELDFVEGFVRQWIDLHLFERAAFALAPGEVSDLAPTRSILKKLRVWRRFGNLPEGGKAVGRYGGKTERR